MVVGVTKGLFLVTSMALIVFLLSFEIVLAQVVELPSKKVFMGAWEIYDTGGALGPVPGLISRTDAYYAAHPHIYYRVLIYPNGSEKVLDSYKFVFSEVGTNYQPYPGHMRVRIWAEGEVPGVTIHLNESGNYSVELRHVEIPKPTAEKFPEAGLNSVVDWYAVQRVEEANAEHDESCTRAVGWVCWKEIKVAENVKVAEYAQVYETYTFSIEPLPKIQKTGSPFSSSNGKNTPSSSGLAFAVGISLSLAALVSRKVKIKTVLSPHGAEIEQAALTNSSLVGRIRARYKAWLRFMYWGKVWARRRKAEAAKRRKNEKLLEAELANLERMHTREQKVALLERIKRYRGKVRKKYERKIFRIERRVLGIKKIRKDVLERRRNERLLGLELANIRRLYTIEQKVAALKKVKRKYKNKVRKKFEKEIEKLERSLHGSIAEDKSVVYAKSFTPGPNAVLSAAPVGLKPIEEGVDSGALNFGEALRLNEDYGYELSKGLEVIYQKNSFVRFMNKISERIYETQTKAIERAERSPEPLRAIRKFAHGFTREIGTAVPSLAGNGWFALGAVGVTLIDSVRNPRNALKNFTMLYEGGMGSIFRGAMEMYRTIRYEDPAVAAGAVAAFIIAPEEVLVGSMAGRAMRVASKGSKIKRAYGARLGKRGRSEIGIGERATIKGFEYAEVISERTIAGEGFPSMEVLKKGTETLTDFAQPNNEK